MTDRIDSRIDTYQHIQTVQRFMSQAIRNLDERRQVHDQSKLQSPEVEVFDEFTPKLATSTYGSEEYKGFLAAMKPALDHHYAANSHHPEHFRWHCPVCNGQFNAAEYEAAPQGPNDTGWRYCPECSGPGLIYETQLMDKPCLGINGMSLLDLLEMLCDWKAATMRHNDGNLLRSIEINQKRFGYSDDLKRILLNTVAEMGLE